MAKKNKPQRPSRNEAAAGSSLLQVYNHIKERILRLEYPPGMSLSEIDFVSELKISRTPVREALIKLASEGLVVLHQNRGAWVSEITLSDIRQFFEALDVAQRMVTRLAALRFNPASLTALELHAKAFDKGVRGGGVSQLHEANFRFHAVIADNCGNALVRDHYLKLLNIGMRISHLALAYERAAAPRGSKKLGLGNISDEHRDLVKSLAAGDADRAEELARLHTLHFRQRVWDYLNSNDAATLRVGD